VELLLRRAGTGAAADSTAPAPSTVSPLEPSARLCGMYSCMADSGWFIECFTGRRLPVAQEGDNAALEAAYAKARSAPGDVLLAQWRDGLDAHADGGAGPTGDPDRRSFPEHRAARSNATLENTYLETDPARGRARERRRAATRAAPDSAIPTEEKWRASVAAIGGRELTRWMATSSRSVRWSARYGVRAGDGAGTRVSRCAYESRSVGHRR
jgi:hypothetical protein